MRRFATLVPALLFAAACAGPAVGPREGPPPAPEQPGPTPETAPFPQRGSDADRMASPSWESLRAVLWMQTSAEYRAVALQTFRAAERLLPELLSDPGFTAALEQDGGYRDLPPAVVLDVDETVLDNSPYQARLILDAETFGPATWHAWVEEARAEEVPGAVAFTRLADSLGVRVFYVTNRNAPQEAATRRNLEALGFPVAPGEDVLLTRGEREGWGSDKASRRGWVAERYRIVMLLGDDFNDFASGVRAGLETREAVFHEVRPLFGHGWFMLPNPQYGSWEAALLAGEGEPGDAERRWMLLERLRPER